MTALHILLIALVQGLTEWLPVSSSAHLALLPAVTGLPDQGPLIDAMAHFGTLLAVLVWFRGDFADAARGLHKLARRHARAGSETRLALTLLVTTPPALIAGLGVIAWNLGQRLRQPDIVAAATIGFGILLWWADHRGSRSRGLADMRLRDALVIGLTQALALIPGASRSGLVATAALALGFNRADAARFSMLSGAPILAAAGAYAALELALSSPSAPEALLDGIAVAILSFAAALASIGIFMRLARRIGFGPFVVYRLLLGTALLLCAPLSGPHGAGTNGDHSSGALAGHGVAGAG